MVFASALMQKAVLATKKFLYGRWGEPYRIGERTLRFVPGTRPVRLRYVTSPNDVVRYDALQVQFLSSELTEGDTAIDIGAHSGVYSLIMALRCGRSGVVVAFEPDPYAREVLMQNIRLNPSVKPPLVEPFACSDGEGEAILYSGGAGTAQSSLVRSAVEFSPLYRKQEIKVRLVGLDEYMRATNLPTPRWVKIDAEGAEIRILQGARELLSTNAGILCELHPWAWDEFGSTYDQFLELVRSSGRKVRFLDHKTFDPGAKPVYGTVVLERS